MEHLYDRAITAFLSLLINDDDLFLGEPGINGINVDNDGYGYEYGCEHWYD